MRFRKRTSASFHATVVSAIALRTDEWFHKKCNTLMPEKVMMGLPPENGAKKDSYSHQEKVCTLGSLIATDVTFVALCVGSDYYVGLFVLSDNYSLL